MARTMIPKAPILGLEDVALRLNVNAATVRTWTKQRKISCTRIGKVYRFSEKDVEDFLSRGRMEYEELPIAVPA